MNERKNKKSEYLTLMIIPHWSKRVRQLRISKPILKLFLSISVVGLIALSGVLAHYAVLIDSSMQNRTLRSENVKLKEELIKAEEQINIINRDIERLESMDIKLKAMTSFEASKQSLAIGPVSTEGRKLISRNKFENYSSMLQENIDAKLAFLDSHLDELKKNVADRERSFGKLIEYFEGKRMLLASMPSIWPVKGWVTSEFGIRRDPYTHLPAMHQGIDIATPEGTIVKSPSDGIVVFAGINGGYGKTLTINHGYGVSTKYSHLAEFFVNVGKKVKRGNQIGSVGDTGRTTGPHLHYEVHVDGVPVNPRKFILE